MKDCRDLLDVYQSAHSNEWITTVEQVKAIHKSPLLARHGWLVAEDNGTVCGEIRFFIEKNLRLGKTGVIMDLQVDARHFRNNVADQLVAAAERIMKEHGAEQVFHISTPENYNFWMNSRYFSKGDLLSLKAKVSDIPQMRTKRVETREVQDPRHLPKSMRFSAEASPGSLALLAEQIIMREMRGRLLEFYAGNKLVGIGAIAVDDEKHGRFVADIAKNGEDYRDVIIARTARGASRWRCKIVESIILVSQKEDYERVANWDGTKVADIPVMKVL